jgi:hypothetical protein
MTRDEIIRMAREAGGDDWGIFRDFMPEIECFANLVAAAEREACAKVAEQIEREIFDAVGDPRVSEFKPKIAAAIRARGQE